MPGPQVPSEAPASAVRAAWLPVQAGQKIPMLGEVVTDDAESSFDE